MIGNQCEKKGHLDSVNILSNRHLMSKLVVVIISECSIFNKKLFEISMKKCVKIESERWIVYARYFSIDVVRKYRYRKLKIRRFFSLILINKKNFL
jgi:hypothetical protein